VFVVRARHRCRSRARGGRAVFHPAAVVRVPAEVREGDDQHQHKTRGDRAAVAQLEADLTVTFFQSER